MSRESMQSLQRKSTMKNQTPPAIDTTWMEPSLLGKFILILDKKIWVEYPGTDEIFKMATLESVQDNKVQFKTLNNKTDSKELHLIQERSSDYKDENQQSNILVFFDSKGQDDMVNMEIINDAELLANLAIRYKKNLIFTYVGPTLLAVNPFQKLTGYYENEIKQKYIEAIVFQSESSSGSYKDQPPHVYAIAAISFKSLFENQKNQAIVISGESGAGKTENAKFAMNLLTKIGSFQTDLQQSGVKKLVGIEEKILSCNPILEAFGNAKTVRNNNSSRFGKYVRMIVSKQSKQIIGATITNYLLEKSRLVAQAPKERNFHIFYIIIKGMEAAKLESIFLSNNGNKVAFDELKYLAKENHEYDVKGVDDVKLFQEIMETVDILGLRSFLKQILRILASILFLGNMEFDDSKFDEENRCFIKDPSIAQKISTLLEIPEDQVSKCVCFISRVIQGQTIDSPLQKSACQGLRDSWARAIYGRLFNWLVQKLNENIKPEINSNSYEVGLLDIYGFEVFEVNGFEQIMINYTNEKLQQLYILYVFKEEEAIFAQEGLSEYQTQIKFEDNQDVIDLLEKPKQGIFEVLDDSCQIKTDDIQLLENIKKVHGGNPLFDTSKINKTTFKIIHTAKDVEYTILGFREKNLDELSNLVLQVNQQSNNQLIKELFSQEINKKDKTASKQIRSSMAELMKDLRACDVHFIRCIKPNEKKEPSKISADYTLNQIRYDVNQTNFKRYLGVLASLKVRKLNYPIRRPYQQFYQEFGDMTNNKAFPLLVRDKVNFRDLVMKMFQDHFPSLKANLVLMGNQKIFIRIQAIPIIEKLFREKVANKRKAAQRKFIFLIIWLKKKMKQLLKVQQLKCYYSKQINHITKLQRWFRFYRFQKKKREQKTQIQTIQAAFKRYIEVIAIKKQKESVLKIQRIILFIMKNKRYVRKRFVRSQVYNAFNLAWEIIINQKATKIQKVMRGFLVRKHHKVEIDKIKEAGRQCRMKKIAVKIQKVARGHIIRQGLRRMNRAAYYIQGFFKMRWLSDLFFTMRAKVVVIQHQVRAFLQKKRLLREKYEKYILPWENQLIKQKLKEENHLFGIGDFIENPVTVLPQKDLIFSPFVYRTPSPPRRESFPSPEYKQNLDFEEILARSNNNKLTLFGFIVDLEIFLDTSEYFPDSYSKNFKQVFDHVQNNANFVQTFHVGNTHAFATTSLGNLYCWGMNDFYQLGISKPTLKPMKPFSNPFLSSLRLKQVAVGNDHSLFLTTEGQVFLCGSNEQGQQLGRNGQLSELEFDCKISSIEASYNSSFAIGENGKLYSWPVGGEEQFSDQIPYEIQIPTAVSQVSVGGQFAIILGTNGCLYSFGQNQCGQLGQGDLQMRMKPSIIKGFENIKFSHVSCGFKHAISKTTLGKIFTWGWGEHGQLGNSQFQSLSTPKQVRLDLGNVIQVQAGMKCSIVLIENKTIYWTGSNGTISYQGSFCKLKIEAKCPTLVNGNYSPIRLMSSFSRSISIIYVTFIQHNNKWEGQPQLRKNILKTLSNKWLEQYNTIDPPLIESIAKYFAEIHMKLPLQLLKENSSIKNLKIQQNQNQNEQKYLKKKQEDINFNSKSSISNQQYKIEVKPTETVLVKQEYQQSSIEDEYEKQKQLYEQLSPKQQQLNLSNLEQTEQIQNPLSSESGKPFRQEIESQIVEEQDIPLSDEKIQQKQIEQQNLIESNNNQVSFPNKSVVSQKQTKKYDQKQKTNDRGRQQVQVKSQQKQNQLSKQQISPQKLQQLPKSPSKSYIQKPTLTDLQGRSISPKKAQSQIIKQQEKKKQSTSPSRKASKQTQQKSQIKQISPTHAKQIKKEQKNNNVMDQKKQDEREKTENSLCQETDPEGKIKKLREIKERLILIKNIPEHEWSAQDQEFLLSIYSQNLNVLLEKII